MSTPSILSPHSFPRGVHTAPVTAPVFNSAGESVPNLSKCLETRRVLHFHDTAERNQKTGENGPLPVDTGVILPLMTVSHDM